MAQVIGGGPDIEPDRGADERVGIVLEIGLQQTLHRWPDAIDNRLQVLRLVDRGLLKLFERRDHRTALRMTEDDDQARPIALRGEFDAADLRRGDDVSGDADDEQIAESL